MGVFALCERLSSTMFLARCALVMLAVLQCLAIGFNYFGAVLVVFFPLVATIVCVIAFMIFCTKKGLLSYMVYSFAMLLTAIVSFSIPASKGNVSAGFITSFVFTMLLEVLALGLGWFVIVSDRMDSTAQE